MAKGRRKERAAKHQTVRLIEAQLPDGTVSTPYKVLRSELKLHHRDLDKAKIALAWHMTWKANADGLLNLGKAKKASELDKSLHTYDFIIILNHKAWNEGKIIDTPDYMAALMDHELAHCAPSIDPKTGEQRHDDSGRLLWRIRKHDMEEFYEVVKRHGPYKADIEKFARAALASAASPLLEPKPEPEPEPEPAIV